MSTEARIRELLTPLCGALESDGYGLEVSLQPDLIRLHVVAGPEACADCLVPRELMEEMFRAKLPMSATGLGHDNVALSYPEGS